MMMFMIIIIIMITHNNSIIALSRCTGNVWESSFTETSEYLVKCACADAKVKDSSRLGLGLGLMYHHIHRFACPHLPIALAEGQHIHQMNMLSLNTGCVVDITVLHKIMQSFKLFVSE